jgi:hypothetical protein
VPSFSDPGNRSYRLKRSKEIYNISFLPLHLLIIRYLQTSLEQSPSILVLYLSWCHQLELLKTCPLSPRAVSFLLHSPRSGASGSSVRACYMTT